MNRLLLALVLMLCASVCLTGCNNQTGKTDQTKEDTKTKDAKENTPTKKTDGDKAEDKKPKEDEVVYKSKSADQWIKQLADQDEQTQLDAVTALTSIGTKGGEKVPLALLDSLNGGDRILQTKKQYKIGEAFAGLYPLFDKKQRLAAYSNILGREIKKDTDDWARQMIVCELIEITQKSSDEKARDGAAYGPLLDTFMKRPGCDGELRTFAARAREACK